MLTLTRKESELIILFLANGEQIQIKLSAINGNQASIGIDAPDDVEIWREELLDGGRPSVGKRCNK